MSTCQKRRWVGVEEAEAEEEPTDGLSTNSDGLNGRRSVGPRSTDGAHGDMHMRKETCSSTMQYSTYEVAGHVGMSTYFCPQ